jgi:hypothetical protein
MNISFPSLLGWIGTASYLVAYFLLSVGKLRADRKLYHVLNILGGVGLTYNAIVLDDVPNVVVNIAWAAIAAWAIWLIFRRRG